MSERQGIDIDYCPRCRGVWLDRGELDKMIERAAPATVEPAYAERPYREDDERHRRGSHRRRSFLGDIFDFD